MEHIFDKTGKLKLNPRQIYIVLRKENEKYRETFEALVEATKADEIRYCVIDTTRYEMQPVAQNLVYRLLMEKELMDGPWDIVVRDYPQYRREITLSCEHITGEDDAAVRTQLEELRKWQEERIWEIVLSGLGEKLMRTSGTMDKRSRFMRTMNSILRSRGLSQSEASEEWKRLKWAFDVWMHDDVSPKGVIKDFVGDNMSLLDAYFDVDTPRTVSDQFMRTFFESGGLVNAPCLKIVKSGSRRGVHGRFALEVATGGGTSYYPKFKTSASFAMYVFYMMNPGIHIRREDFDPTFNAKVAKDYCQRLMAINATLGENLFEREGESLQKAIKKHSGFWDKLMKDDKFWNTTNNYCVSALRDVMKEEGEPYVMRAKDECARECWLEMSADYIDCAQADFMKAYKENLKVVEAIEQPGTTVDENAD